MKRFRSTGRLTKKQVDEDEKYLTLVEEAQSQDDSDCYPNMSENPVETCVDLSEDNSVKDVWLEAPTRMLISLLMKLQPNLGKTFDLKNKTKMWERIQKAMADEGYNFSVKQVHGKYRTMERKYKLAKLHKTKKGRKRKCPYEREFDKLFEEKRDPDLALDNGDIEVNTKPSEKCSVTKKEIKQPESTEDKILKKLDEMSKEKAQFRASLLQRLEKKEQIEQERNELLKRIAVSLESSFNLFIEPISGTEK